LKLFKKFFPSSSGSQSDNTSDDDQLQLATCILLIEVSKSDDDYDVDEQKKIKSLLQKKFEMSKDEIENIYALCDKEHNRMTSLFEWTDIINKECNYEQKCIIIGFMWDIAFIDSKIDKYEDLTIRKVSDLIHVKHKDFISLKNERAI